MRYWTKDDINAARRVGTLHRKHWPAKDIAAKMTEEGLPPFGGRSKWNRDAVKAALEAAAHVLTHDEMSAWCDEMDALMHKQRELIDRLPKDARDAALSHYFKVEMMLKEWAVQEASDLQDGESLRRLQPGMPALHILPRTKTVTDPDDATEPDPDNHHVWTMRQRERTENKNRTLN